jgi:hypothetical protein
VCSLTLLGVAKQRTWVQDMHVNVLPKSDPETCRHVTFLCILFLLHVQYNFNMETKPVMRCLNAMQFSSINMYGCYTNQNHLNNPMNTYRFGSSASCAFKSISSRSLGCTSNWESRFLEPSSSVILHWKRLNRFF